MKNKYSIIALALMLAGLITIAYPHIETYASSQQHKKIVNQIQRKNAKKLPKGVIGYIQIDKIGVKYAIKENDTAKNLTDYICHLKETAKIGAKGNCVLAGHRGGRRGNFFLRLNRLRKGDTVKVADKNGKVYQYRVTKTATTGKYANYVKDQDKRFRELTLITCESKGKQRIVVKCRMK